MGLFDFLVGKKKQEVLLPLDPELVKRDQTIRGLSQQVQARDAQLAQQLALISELQGSKQIDKQTKEIEEISRLKEDEKELKKNKFGKSFSLTKFYWAYLRDKKFRDKLEICDKDDAEVLGKFGDLLFLEGGYLALTDSHGNIMAYGKQLNHVIYKPDSLGNQIRRGRIQIPYDKNYNPSVDLEDIALPEIIYDKEKKTYRFTKHVTKTAQTLILEKDKQLRETQDYAEQLEKTNVAQKIKIDDLERTLNVSLTSTNTSNSELSKLTDKLLQYQAVNGTMHNQIVQLTEMKALNESTIEKLENTVSNLLAKVEEMGDKTEFRRALETVKEVIDYAKTRLPKQITIQAPAEEKPKEPTIPGQKLN